MRAFLVLGLLLSASVATAAEPMPVAKYRAFDSNGIPLAGGKLYSYQAGTSTPLATYTTRAGNVANSNPVVLNSNGEADVWLAPNTLYKLELRNAAGVVQWVVDNVPGTPDLGSLSTFATGITVTNSNTNAAGASVTGNGSAPGVSATGGATGTGLVATGGATSGAGVKGTATGAKNGVVGLGAGAATTTADDSGLGGLFVGQGGTADSAVLGGSAAGGTGVYAIGGGSGAGITARAPAGNGARIFGGGANAGAVVRGGAGGAGIDVAAGSGESSTARLEAIDISAGDIRFQHTAPASTTAMRNRLTRSNIPKAWARLVSVGGGSASVTTLAGFNITSASASTTTMTVTLAEPMASSNYAVVVSATTSSATCGANPSGASTIVITCKTVSGAGDINFQTTVQGLSLLVFGEQ